ncbi:MAG: nicotinate-nucleotide adenylyltransferase [Clostridia bacterium]|nr:nicotinate-nucleotide adenylyltransferase [Clostridia bacterium]
MKQVGIMGGTFDPPHIGHLMIAETVRETLSLEEVRFIPTGQISYKDSRETAEAQHRLEMVSLAIQDNPYFSVDGMEVEREGYSYTWQTLTELRQKEPDTAFTFMVGADSLDYMERWVKPEIVFQMARIAVVLRPGFSLTAVEKKKKELEERFSADIIIVPMPEMEISSTEIRHRISQGKSVRDQIPEKVEAYIRQHQLYRR